MCDFEHVHSRTFIFTGEQHCLKINNFDAIKFRILLRTCNIFTLNCFSQNIADQYCISVFHPQYSSHQNSSVVNVNNGLQFVRDFMPLNRFADTCVMLFELPLGKFNPLQCHGSNTFCLNTWLTTLRLRFKGCVLLSVERQVDITSTQLFLIVVSMLIRNLLCVSTLIDQVQMVLFEYSKLIRMVADLYTLVLLTSRCNGLILNEL